jgi:hypothetical protein
MLKKKNKYTYERENWEQIFLSLLMDHIFYIISTFYIYLFFKVDSMEWWVSYSFDTIKVLMMVLRD